MRISTTTGAVSVNIVRMLLSRLRHWFDQPDSGSRPTESTNRFKVLDADTLLGPFKGDIAGIRARVGVPPDHWRLLYESLLRNYASLVQQLPASEAHHHAGLGGLLQHGLEVARHTLDLKQGIMLPPGAAPEDQARLQDLWTYACVTAALLHDLGKPVTDQHVAFYNGYGRACGFWSPLSGPMPEGRVYGIEFNSHRVYRQHERIPPLLAHHLIPPEGLEWLASDSDALFAWLAAIQGSLSDAGPIGEIIGKADGLSVARNLSGSNNVPLPTTRAKPLSERLMTGLRYLLENGDIPLNRRGAAGYLDGDTLWLVSKTTLDKLRTHLIEEGQPGIPTRNDRLMDELQQHGSLVANGDRAVWLCAITIGDWKQQLTCLRFDADRIWSDSSRRPDPVEGSVAPVDNAASKEASSPETGGENPAPTANTRGSANVDTASQPSDSQAPCSVSDSASSTTDGLPMPFDTNALADSTRDATSTDDQTAESDQEPSSAHGHSAAANSRHFRASNGQVEGMDSIEDAGQRFLAWLTHGIREGLMEINSPKARIHVLPEGLALVSPRIFRDFDSANWSHVQKRFQKLAIHRKTPRDQNIWTCRTTGSRKQGLLKVILIPNPESALSVPVPQRNAAVSLVNNIDQL